jgi:hypothetical protein
MERVELSSRMCSTSEHASNALVYADSAAEIFGNLHTE